MTFPNFRRWEQYLQSASAADGSRSILLWQVPVGNQYFDTENDTNDHYQDNRPEYIFSHVSELIQNRISGAIFAPGNAGNTSYTDSDNDGIVNPASFCTTNGASSGQICNNDTATVADDDGGFIRISAETYYQNPVALTGAATTSTATPTPRPTVASTYTTSAAATPIAVAPGQTVTIASSITSSQASTVLVDVEVYDPSSSKVFQQYWDNQAFTAGQTRTYSSSWQIPSNAASGSYTVDIGVFSTGWGTLYNWNGSAGTVSVSTAAATSTPTAVPTNTPTAVPTSTPTAIATNTRVPTATATSMASKPSYTTSATLSPTTISGGTVSITTKVKSATASSVLVDVEVYSAPGTKVFQQYWNNQSFSACQTRTSTSTGSVPSTMAASTRSRSAFSQPIGASSTSGTTARQRSQ